MKPNQFLRFRDNDRHYKPRIPIRYAEFDDRGVIRFSLKTDSLDIARIRRDAQAQADDLFWASLVAAKTRKILQPGGPEMGSTSRG